MNLVCVDPEKVEKIWPHVSMFLQSAYVRGSGDDDLESLKRDLDDKKALLWVVWDGNGIIAAAATKLIKTSTKIVCVIAACGGRDLVKWLPFIADLESYAKAENCDEMRVMGRHGWQKFLPEYYQPWVCLAKRLK